MLFCPRLCVVLFAPIGVWVVILLLLCVVLLFHSHWGFGFVILLSLCVVLLFYSHSSACLLLCSHYVSLCNLTLMDILVYYFALIVCSFVIFQPLECRFVLLLSLFVVLLSNPYCFFLFALVVFRLVI